MAQHKPVKKLYDIRNDPYEIYNLADIHRMRIARYSFFVCRYLKKLKQL